MDDLLKKIYGHTEFNKTGHELIDLLTSYLRESSLGNDSVIRWKEPEEQLKFWKEFNLNNNDPTKLFKSIIENSIHLHNPNYMGHQLCPPAPIASLIGLVGELLNNGMAIYEMGPAATAIEKVIIDLIAKKVGYDSQSDGFITSGGTIGNLTALLAARQVAFEKDIWEDGLDDNLGVIISGEAHYSVDRALRIMGFGSKGIIKVPVDDNFAIRIDLLDSYYKKAAENGINIIAAVGSAPSTSTGIYDDLLEMSKFCNEKGIWFHVDAAHGGGVIFSDKYKYLMEGAQYADSVLMDGHKMLMTPALLTMVIFKSANNSYSTFNQKAQYLWEKSQDEEWFNLARRTLECTKLMMSIKLYSILALYGEDAFDLYVTHLYDISKNFSSIIKGNNVFELALEPQSNIICFRYSPNRQRSLDLDELDSFIREKLLREGDFYIVKTLFRGSVYLRTTIINPMTSIANFNQLLERIIHMGNSFMDNLNGDDIN